MLSPSGEASGFVHSCLRFSYYICTCLMKIIYFFVGLLLSLKICCYTKIEMSKKGVDSVNPRLLSVHVYLKRNGH